MFDDIIKKKRKLLKSTWTVEIELEKITPLYLYSKIMICKKCGKNYIVFEKENYIPVEKQPCLYCAKEKKNDN